jgi:hypothetical protein
MRHPGIWLFAVPAMFFGNCISWVQAPKKFSIVVPDSSVPRAQDHGVRAQTISSPSLAGIVNLAGHFATNTQSELTTIYANRTNSADFRDITSGSAGSFSAGPGYDFVTGVGSDRGLNGK